MAPCGVKRVWSTQWAFLAELQNGEFVAWGNEGSGGNIAAAGVKASLEKVGVKHVWSTGRAFLAELQDGKFVAWGEAWGDKDYGGDIAAVKPSLEKAGVRRVWSTGYAFLAELQNGECVAWGTAPEEVTLAG